jgi:chaperonin GroEL (HSP60 family)
MRSKQLGSPVVCNDGVAIAKELSLEDPEEDLDDQMLLTETTMTEKPEQKKDGPPSLDSEA